MVHIFPQNSNSTLLDQMNNEKYGNFLEIVHNEIW